MKQSRLPRPPPLFKLSCAIAATAAQPLHSLAGFRDVGKPFATSDAERREHMAAAGKNRSNQNASILLQLWVRRPMFENQLSKYVTSTGSPATQTQSITWGRELVDHAGNGLPPRSPVAASSSINARGIISRFLRANNASERGGCLPACLRCLSRPPSVHTSHSSLREPNNPLGRNAQMGQIWPQGTCLTLFSCPEKEFLNLASDKCSSWLLKDYYPA